MVEIKLQQNLGNLIDKLTSKIRTRLNDEKVKMKQSRDRHATDCR